MCVTCVTEYYNGKSSPTVCLHFGGKQCLLSSEGESKKDEKPFVYTRNVAVNLVGIILKNIAILVSHNHSGATNLFLLSLQPTLLLLPLLSDAVSCNVNNSVFLH